MRRHDLDPVSLVAGVLFAAIAVVSLLDRADVLDVQGKWVWPMLLIGLGLAGLVAALRPDDRSAIDEAPAEPDTTDPDSTEPVEEGPDATTGRRRATRR